MKIYLTIKPNAKKSQIIKVDETTYKLYTHAEPRENKANEDIIFMLSEYFGISKSQVQILSGFTSKHKTVEILM